MSDNMKKIFWHFFCGTDVRVSLLLVHNAWSLQVNCVNMDAHCYLIGSGREEIVNG